MQRKILTFLFGLNLLLSIMFLNQGQSTSVSNPLPLASQFKRIDQPIALQLGVTLGGAAIIGLELWWFLGSRPKA
jgi:plastocyanin domain-containing protein